MITGRMMSGFESKRMSAASRDPRHADTVTINHLIALRSQVESLLTENAKLKDKIWLLQQELKRIEKE